MKKLSLKNLKLTSQDQLQRDQLKTVFGGYGGYGDDLGINPYCCWDQADLYMEDVPNYSDPEAEGYLTSSERNDIWSYAYDGCMAGGSNGCLPAN